MKFRMILATAVLAFAPTLGLAMGCSDYPKTVMSCADGMVPDTTTGTCVPQTTS